METGDEISIDAVHLGKKAANDYLAIGLQGHRTNHGTVRVRHTGIKRGVESAVCVQAGDIGATDAVHLQKSASNDHPTISL
jgi:hypothetical protein